MKQWTRLFLAGLVGLSLSFAACDSDSNTTTDTLQADTMQADTAEPADTMGGDDTTAATGGCTNAADLARIQDTTKADPTAVATSCGTSASCIGLAFSDIPAFGTCVQNCMTDATTGAGLTEACSLCYGAAVVCTAEHCLAAPANCATNPTGEDCIQCRADNGCTGDFYTCSGLPQN